MRTFNFSRVKLPKPTSQTQEALYFLIRYEQMTRKDFMDMAFIMNAPACINRLRKRGIAVITETVSVTNKFGRKITFGVYCLADRNQAIAQYKEMTNN